MKRTVTYTISVRWHCTWDLGDRVDRIYSRLISLPLIIRLRLFLTREIPLKLSRHRIKFPHFLFTINGTVSWRRVRTKQPLVCLSAFMSLSDPLKTARSSLCSRTDSALPIHQTDFPPGVTKKKLYRWYSAFFFSSLQENCIPVKLRVGVEHSETFGRRGKEEKCIKKKKKEKEDRDKRIQKTSPPFSFPLKGGRDRKKKWKTDVEAEYSRFGRTQKKIK